MLLTLDTILLFLLLGMLTGFMAGLLGIGGGGIMVPVLTSIFLYKDVPVEFVVHIALGTSMAAIIATSAASLYAHHKHQAVLWPLVRIMAPGVIAGTFIATYLAASISVRPLAVFFALFMACVAVQICLDIQASSSKTLPGRMAMLSAGSGIGAVSALVAIGGGTLTVPFLTWHNVSIRKAIATSAALGFPIAVAGAGGYLVNGWNLEFEQDYLLGFIYLPAVIFISMMACFTAPLGARLTHKLPIPAIKKIFAIFLILLSLKMLIAVFST